MEVDAKKVSFAFEDGKFLLKVDLNQDGEPFLTLALDVKEVPDEVLAMFKKEE